MVRALLYGFVTSLNFSFFYADQQTGILNLKHPNVVFAHLLNILPRKSEQTVHSFHPSVQL